MQNKNKGWRTLTPQEVRKFRERMVTRGRPVRFMYDGQSVDIVTGQTISKGANVMHQIVYWNFDVKTAKEIAELTGTKAVF